MITLWKCMYRPQFLFSISRHPSIATLEGSLHLRFEILTSSSSDSTSGKYGKHWTPEQVHDAFAPKKETVTSVTQWLTDSGIEDSRIMFYENKGWIAVDVTVEEIEGLLRAEFHEHEHSRTSKVRVGTDKYALSNRCDANDC